MIRDNSCTVDIFDGACTLRLRIDVEVVSSCAQIEPDVQGITNAMIQAAKRFVAIGTVTR